MKEHKPLRGKDYAAAPNTESYADPTPEQQARNMARTQAAGQINHTNRRRAKSND